jgi:hypothetical protein
MSAVLTGAGLLGALLFAALIALWAVGAVGVGECVALAVYGLLREDGRGAAPVVRSLHEVPTLAQVLEKARAS